MGTLSLQTFSSGYDPLPRRSLPHPAAAVVLHSSPSSHRRASTKLTQRLGQPPPSPPRSAFLSLSPPPSPHRRSTPPNSPPPPPPPRRAQCRPSPSRLLLRHRLHRLPVHQPPLLEAHARRIHWPIRRTAVLRLPQLSGAEPAGWVIDVFFFWLCLRHVFPSLHNLGRARGALRPHSPRFPLVARSWSTNGKACNE